MLRESLSNKTLTDNGAFANLSTKSALVDFFGAAGTARRMDEKDIIELFEKAKREDPTSAVVLMFYFRDILEGQGERRLFRVLLKHLAMTETDIAKVVMPYIPEYGRWDDLYALEGTPLELEMFHFMLQQLKRDLRTETPSLLAKWLKGSRPSSEESQRLMRKTYRAFGMNHKEYRKTLSKLRKQLDIVERKMCNREWSEIEYSKVPSQAMKQYIQAFLRNDEVRFKDYIERVVSGEANTKINARTLLPHQIVQTIMKEDYREENLQSQALNALWKNLPSYALEDTLAVVDTSGSMTIQYNSKGSLLPIYAAVGLGIYAAEHVEGEFNNSFITFSERPSFVEFERGQSIREKVERTMGCNWGYNTNLERVFELVLNKAQSKGIPGDQMPKRILIISDMEFDQATEYGDTMLDSITKKYQRAGYKVPQLVFWNVAANTRHYPIEEKDKALLLSGFSPVVLKFLYEGELVSPLELVLDVVNSPRYETLKRWIMIQNFDK